MRKITFSKKLSIQFKISRNQAENLIKNTFIEVSDYATYFKEFKNNKEELSELKSKNISSEITQYENKELKELINDYVSSSDKILAKIIVDHDSPFLKSIIIKLKYF